MLTLGCAVGPALAAMLEESMKFIKINNLILDSDTMPGWFMALLYLLFTAARNSTVALFRQVKLVICLTDLPQDVLGASEASGRTLQSPRSPKRINCGKARLRKSMVYGFQVAIVGTVQPVMMMYSADFGAEHFQNMVLWAVKKY